MIRIFGCVLCHNSAGDCEISARKNQEWHKNAARINGRTGNPDPLWCSPVCFSAISESLVSLQKQEIQVILTHRQTIKFNLKCIVASMWLPLCVYIFTSYFVNRFISLCCMMCALSMCEEVHQIHMKCAYVSLEYVKSILVNVQ